MFAHVSCFAPAVSHDVRTLCGDVGQTSQGAPVAILPEARGALSEDGAGAGPPPQRAAGGGAERGGGASFARQPTGTEDSSTGTRPASLAEPQGPQERILRPASLEQFVDLAPMVQILVAPVPQLVEQLADVLVRVDELVKKEEEEVRRWRRTPVSQLTPLQRKKAFEHISKRKRKKRRKRKTPKTSSSRAVRTQKSGHSSTSSSWYVYSGGVMGSVACGSSILLGMYWLPQYIANCVLDLWTWWKTRVVLPSMLAGFAGYDAPRAVFPSFVALADEARYASGVFHQTTQKTVEIPQLPFFDEVVHISYRGAEADSCGPVLPCPCVAFPQVQFLDKVICPWWNDRLYGPDVQKTVVFHSCSSRTRW